MLFLCITYSLELIALALGGILLMKVLKNKEIKAMCCRIISYIVIIAALIGLVCTSYCLLKFWFAGATYHPKIMMMQQYRGKNMMGAHKMRTLQPTMPAAAKPQ